MSDTGHANPFGFTSGESEGKWSRVDSGLMKYERAGRLIYGSPNSEVYREGWERIFGRKEVPRQEATPAAVGSSPASENFGVAERETHGATQATGCEGEASEQVATP